MLNTILMLIAIVLVIHAIILIHEMGHYIVARSFNIKVKTFAVGLGRPIWQTVHNGVTWRFGIFPIGGYVVLLNTQLDNVPLSELKHSFNVKPLWQKIAVYLAGPLINFIVAIIIYTGIFMSGMYEVKPSIATIIPHSIASDANVMSPSLITKINNKPTQSWRDVSISLISALGRDKTLSLSTKFSDKEQEYHLDIRDWQISNVTFNPIKNIGIKPYLPPTPALVTSIVEGSPAAAKLSVGDKIIKVNNIDVSTYEEYLDAMANLANTDITIVIESNGITKVIPITTSWTFRNGWEMIGYLGFKPPVVKWPADKIYLKKYGFFNAFKAATLSTIQMLSFNFLVLSKIITRIIPMACLSGPIGFIAVAFSSLNSGLNVFLETIAVFNILIAFANILPLPGLDGGNIIFRIIEAIRGQEISYLWQELITSFTIIFLVVLTIHATINDLIRLLT